MSLFIHRENQELLWNIINKSQPFIERFKNSHPNNSTEWFRSIIQTYYYENNLHNIQNITPLTLNTINRNVLSYMVSYLKNSNVNNSNSDNNANNANNVNNFDIKPNTTHFMETSYSRMQSTKEDNYSNQFAARQKEYETMFAKPTPPVDSKLNENIKDEVITNMEELIEQHRKQREDELRIVHPPIYSNQNESTKQNIQLLTSIQTNISSNKVIINESTDLDNVIEVKQNRNVSWTDDQYNNLEKEIQIVKQQLADLILKNSKLEEIVNNIQNSKNSIEFL